MNYEKTVEMKLALSSHFGIRQNLIVPNISLGLGIHECDLLILAKSGYLYERESKKKINSTAYKVSEEDRYQIARLGAMRIAGLKRKLVKLREKQLN